MTDLQVITAYAAHVLDTDLGDTAFLHLLHYFKKARADEAALRKGTYYKFIMIAAGSNGKVVSTSKTVHAATKGGKVGNHKSIKISKCVIKKAKSLKKGKTFKLKAKAVPQAKKLKVKKHRAVRYETSNAAVA